MGLRISSRTRDFRWVGAVWHRTSRRGGACRVSPVYRLGRNLAHARERMVSVLPIPWVEGTQWTWERELAMAPYGVIQRQERHTLPSGRTMWVMSHARGVCVDPEVRIVASVGELGWTP